MFRVSNVQQRSGFDSRPVHELFILSDEYKMPKFSHNILIFVCLPMLPSLPINWFLNQLAYQMRELPSIIFAWDRVPRGLPVFNFLKMLFLNRYLTVRKKKAFNDYDRVFLLCIIIVIVSICIQFFFTGKLFSKRIEITPQICIRKFEERTA